MSEKNHSIKILQYADDGILFLKNEQELAESIAMIRKFGSYSGTKLNLEKCEGLWLGRQKHKQENCKMLNIKWPQEPMSILGIHIGHNEKENEILNWDKKIM